MTKVLVLGEDGRSCLSIVRSLGRRRIPILLGVQTSDSIVVHSRYVTRTVQMPSTYTEVDSWLDELQRLLEQEAIDLVIPCSDSTLVPIVNHRTRFEKLARLAIPQDSAFEHSFFKNKTLAMANQLGVPIPDSILVENMSGLANVKSSHTLHFPLVVKPISSKVWKGGRGYNLRVGLVQDWPTLEQLVGELTEMTPVLIQNYFGGVGVGQEFLAHEGRILSSFQHERIHERLEGGGSSYRKSAQLNQRMLVHSTEMLSYLRWTGVAMVEYKQNPATGEFVLMEINGRFWGSLPLAVAAGVDFPYDLYQLLMKQQPATPHSYKIGLYSRNVGKDIGWLRQRLSGAKNYSVAISLLIKQLAQGFWNTLLGRERWDTITIDDPLPGLVETLNVFVTAFKRSVSWIWRGVLAILASNKIWRRMQRIKVRRALEVHPNLLFICRGNICRSPFAEAYAKLRMDSLGIRTISAGTYPQEKRPAPEPAQCASREFGVVLDCHRSRSLEVELIKWAGAVVCMDYRDYSELRRVYPEVRNKLFFLAPFDLTTKDFEIADPWGKPVGEFRVAYKQISSSIEGLIESLVNT